MFMIPKVTMIFMFILSKPIVAIVTAIDPIDAARQIANAHTIFNVVNVLILLPFAKYIVKIVLKIMPITEEESEVTAATKYLDERIIQTPSIALGNTVKEVSRMGQKANKALEYSMNSLINKSMTDVEKTVKYEEHVNLLQKEILNYYSIYSLDDSISINDVVIPEARENYEDMVKCSGEYYEYHIALPVLHALCYSCHEGFALPFGLCFLTNLP